MFGITAKHVLLGEKLKMIEANIPKILVNLEKNPISQKFESNAVGIEAGHFSDVDIHPDYDIAIFYPAAKHSYIVNKLRCIDSGFNISRRPSMSLMPQTVVYKHGVATNVTYGKVLLLHKNDPLFYVESTEVGMFATAGDSGSLVIRQDNNNVVGIVIEVNNYGMTKCLSISTLFDILVLKDMYEQCVSVINESTNIDSENLVV